jgi:hypothetical protein
VSFGVSEVVLIGKSSFQVLARKRDFRNLSTGTMRSLSGRDAYPSAFLFWLKYRRAINQQAVFRPAILSLLIVKTVSNAVSPTQRKIFALRLLLTVRTSFGSRCRGNESQPAVVTMNGGEQSMMVRRS